MIYVNKVNITFYNFLHHNYNFSWIQKKNKGGGGEKDFKNL